MDSIGDMLRRARNDQGYTLDDVAARTRISRKHLEAIERNDRSAIPGGFFYKSFVRQYAAALATPDSDLIDDVEQALAAEQPASHHVPDRPVVKRLPAMEVEEHVTASRAPSSVSTYVLLLFLALGGSTGFYIWWRHSQAQAAGQSTRAPESSAAPANNAETTAVARANPGVSPPAPSAAPVSVAASQAAARPEGKIVLDVTAIDLTWFSVTADGKSLYSGTLQPGETKTFAAQDNARMRIGNAGGLDIKYNGKPTGPLGPKGQVRTVVFTPGNFEIVKPVVEDEG